MLSVSSAFANEQIYRRTFHHKRGHFSDSKSYLHRIDMPVQWRNQGYRFYNYQVVTTDRASIYGQHLSDYLFTFTMKIRKSFVEEASGNITIILFARNTYTPATQPVHGNPYPTNGSYPANGSNQNLNGQNWYYPGQTYSIQIDPSRKVNMIEVSWRDAGGRANGVLIVDGRSYGVKEVGNGNSSSPAVSRWSINNFVSRAEIRISTDAAQILNSQVYYINSNSSSPSSGGMVIPANPSYPQAPVNNGNNNNPPHQSGPVTLPTGGHGHTPGHGLPIPH